MGNTNPIAERRFEVALSFPGSKRDYVRQVAGVLAHALGPASVFFDEFYQEELAIPNLDIRLQQIYEKESDLVVPFFCENYANQKWCNIEWNAIRAAIFSSSPLKKSESTERSGPGAIANGPRIIQWPLFQRAARRDDDALMVMRFDNVEIHGLLWTTGFIAIDDKAPVEVAEPILRRVERRRRSDSPTCSGRSKARPIDLRSSGHTTVDTAPPASDRIEAANGAAKHRVRRGHVDIMRVISDAENVDKAVMRAIRDHKNIPDAEVRKIYRILLEKFSEENGVDVSDLLRRIARRSFPGKDALEAFRSDLCVEIADDLSRIEFVSEKGRLPVCDPLLLWDCHCTIPEQVFPGTKPGPEDCPIHSHPLGAAVETLFGSRLVEIVYRGMRFLWRDIPQFWPPAIDSIHMLNCLLCDGTLDGGTETLLDLGCGTGFLGVALAGHLARLRELYFSDWLLTPVIMTKINWRRNRPPNTRARVHVGLGMENHFLNVTMPRGKRLNVCVCNPPYLPLLSRNWAFHLTSTVSGTDLLQWVIINGRRIADRVFVNLSRVARPEVEEALHLGRATLRLLSGTHTIPLRIPEIFRDTAYVASLVDEQRVEARVTGRYPIWHEIGTYEVVYQ